MLNGRQNYDKLKMTWKKADVAYCICYKDTVMKVPRKITKTQIHELLSIRNSLTRISRKQEQSLADTATVADVRLHFCLM